MEKSISIYAGVDKSGNQELYDVITLKLGDIVSIVGHTGSGKTLLISDIEQLAQRDSLSKRKILIDNSEPSYDDRFDPTKKKVAMITQNTKCVTDLYVYDFLQIHAQSRNFKDNDKDLIKRVVNLANLFTGESLSEKMRVTELSGGQTRALLFADAIIIGSSPIILVDEIENAGINKNEIIKYIKGKKKLVIFVTHDPAIILQTQKRILMKNGGISKIINNSEDDQQVLNFVKDVDKKIKNIQELIREGSTLNNIDLKDVKL